MPPVVCDRLRLTCRALQFTGTNLAELLVFVAPAQDRVVEEHGRVILKAAGGDTSWRWLDKGDWILEGVGPGWDFYVVRAEKMVRLWKPRARSS